MGEIKKIVVEHFPADKLPEELRRGIESGQMVRVTVESDAEETAASEPRTLMSFLGSAPGLYATPEEATAFIRSLRDESDR